MVDGDREIWYLPAPGSEGTFVVNVHSAGQCAGKGCAFHGPSDHWARDMPLTWVHDKGGKVQRICPHGARHDDPDDWAFRRKMGENPSRYAKCDCGCACTCETYVPF